LAEADRAGLIDRPQTLASAARLVAELQNDNGSWSTDAAGTVGSPVTYGQPLATHLAAESLRQFDAHEYAAQLGKARSWFEATAPKSVLDAAATLLALAEVQSPKAKLRRDEALKLIRAGESPDGSGWGPFVNSPPEVFDTAVVLIALATQKNREDYAEVIARGRQYLIAMQQADGSWPPTTRPPGVDSYAQQMSTTGWALQALLTTNRRQQTTPPPAR